MQLAKYWKLKDKAIKCGLCPRECSIAEGSLGYCGVRKNVKNKLYSVVYGRPISINLDPIEKKPFYHFNPGSKVLSFGTLGCNFRCKYCCNWEISQARMKEMNVPEVMPAEIVKLAKEYSAQGIAYTYTEPTIFFEYALDTAKLAKKAGLFNVFVTNGYSMEKPLKDISPYLDAVVIDFKGFNEKFYKEYTSAELEKVKQGALRYKKFTKAHIEITNLIVPGLNDDLKEAEEFVKWVKKNFGEETPIHFIRFFPAYKMKDTPPTSIDTIEKMHELAKDLGMKYVYVGNIPGHELNNTFCPKCKELVIQRQHFNNKYYLKKGKCSKCGQKIDVYGQLH